MAEFKVRNSMAVAAAEGGPAEASLSKFGDLVSMPWVYKLALAGRVYIGGMGIEATDVDGEAALDDTAATWVLGAPSSGLLVIPLYVRLQLTTEGGAAPDAYLTYVSNMTDTGITTSGTAGVALPTLGGTGRGHQANWLYTVTSAAITSAQNVVLWQVKDAPDNLLSVEAVGTGTPIETVGNSMSAVTIPLYPHIPIVLNKGTSLSFYTATGTSDSKWRPTFVWAEVESSLLP